MADVVQFPTTGAAVQFERGDHVEVASRALDRLRAEAPSTYADGHFYQYGERGTFETVPQSRLSTIVQGFAGQLVFSEKKPKPLKLRAQDVQGAIRLAADQAADPEFFEAAKPGIAFRDCFVEVTAKGITHRPHSPEHRARFAHDFLFAREHPELWLCFLEDVFQPDGEEDRAAKMALLQEYLGVCMLGLATKYQRAIVALGDGANGKGVFSSVAERCMPPGSVCAIPPQDVGQEYRRAMLAGKLLNIVSELPEADILDSESWKAIVAGDTTTGREIRKEPFTFRPIAGHIYSANRLPGTTDQTHGFWRRLIVVRFGRVFAEREQDPTLADRIVETERPAIVSWALAGAQRVLARGHYTVPPSSAAAMDAWRASSDQVRAFVDERCERLPLDSHPTHGHPAAALYRVFRQWATDNGHRPMASNKFAERMRLLGLEAHKTRAGKYHPVTVRHEVES